MKTVCWSDFKSYSPGTVFSFESESKNNLMVLDGFYTQYFNSTVSGVYARRLFGESEKFTCSGDDSFRVLEKEDLDKVVETLTQT